MKADDPLLTLESDKATMEVPSPGAGRIAEILVKVGDRVSMGTPILRLEGKGANGSANGSAPAKSQVASAPAAAAPRRLCAGADANIGRECSTRGDCVTIPAGAPRLRQCTRQPLGSATGARTRHRSGEDQGHRRKGTHHAGGRQAVAAGAGRRRAVGRVASGGMGIPEIPAVDFSKFGAIETLPLSRIKKLSGPHLHRAWLNIPHVTNTDEADITEIETYRKERDEEGKTAKDAYRVSLLPFLMKACVAVLKSMPQFNSSLTPEKDALIIKKYYHIGVAVDTPDGLVVPVVRDVDRKGIIEISQELGKISEKARNGKLAATEMQGASFSISSLGGIGGTGFTPIVNAPEVAILGRGAREDGAGLGWQDVPAAADAAAVPQLRSSRHRRRGGGAVPALAGERPRRLAAAD